MGRTFSEKNIEYSVAIRTLGTAGNKYQCLLESLISQTIPPKRILVYIAEGYDIPKETVGLEQYVYVKKGMVSQRALQYKEIETEYILFLDDDLYLPNNTVEEMFNRLIEYQADVIAPDIFAHNKRRLLGRILMGVSGRMLPRKYDGYWGYKVMRNSGFSYTVEAVHDVLFSQTNAGACFLCKKDKFIGIQFDEELWLDQLTYAQGDDQVMFYKMYLKGYKILTWYNHGIKHLDAGMNYSKGKEQQLIYSDIYFKIIFWYKFIFQVETSILMSIWDVLCILYSMIFLLCSSLIRLDFTVLRIKLRAINNAVAFIKSKQYIKYAK